MSEQSQPTSCETPVLTSIASGETVASEVPLWKPITAVVLACITLFFTKVITPAPALSEPYVKMDLPQAVGLFWGTEGEVSEAERAILPPDTEFARMNYSDGLGNELNCQIVLAGAEKRSIHRPEVCLPGQGWTVESTGTSTVRLSNGKRLQVQRLIITRPVTLMDGRRTQLRSVFCYWFTGKNLTTPSHLERILRTNFDMLMHNINHRWAYTIVSAPILEGLVYGGKNEEETTQLVKDFIATIAPKITKHLSDDMEQTSYLVPATVP